MSNEQWPFLHIVPGKMYNFTTLNATRALTTKGRLFFRFWRDTVETQLQIICYTPALQRDLWFLLRNF